MPFGNSLIVFRPKSGCVASPLDSAGNRISRGPSPQARGPTTSPHAGLGASDAVSGLRGASRRSQGLLPQPDSGRCPGTRNFRMALCLAPPFDGLRQWTVCSGRSCLTAHTMRPLKKALPTAHRQLLTTPQRCSPSTLSLRKGSRGARACRMAAERRAPVYVCPECQHQIQR